MKHLPRRPATRCLRWATLLAVVFALALASRRYRVFVVDGDSMAPGLHTGDLLLVARGALTQERAGALLTELRL